MSPLHHRRARASNPNCHECQKPLAELPETIEVLRPAQDLFAQWEPVLICSDCHQVQVARARFAAHGAD